MQWNQLDSIDEAILKSDVLKPETMSVPGDEDGDGRYSPQEIAELTKYWSHELQRAYQVRKGRETAWRAARRAMQAKQNRVYKTNLSNNKDSAEYTDPTQTPFRVSNAIFYSNVEIMASNIMAADPVVHVSDNGDPTSLAMAIQRLVQGKMTYFLRKIRIPRTLMSTVYDALLYNIAICKTGYSANGTYMQAAPRNSAFGIRISPFNFLVDAEAADDDTARWMGEEYYLDGKELKEGNYFNKSKASLLLSEYIINPEGNKDESKAATPSEAVNSDSGNSDIDLGESSSTGQIEAASIKRLKVVDIYDKINRVIITVAMSGKTASCIIAINDIPSHIQGTPYKILTLNHIPDNFYGVSDHELCESKLREIDKIEQRILDGTKSLIPKYAFDKSAVSPTEIETFIKAEMCECVGINGQNAPIDKAIVPFIMAVIPRENFQALVDLRQQINADMGITDFMRGKSETDTATEASLIDAASKTRSQKRQNRFDEFLNEIVRSIYSAMREMQFETLWISEPGMYPVIGTDPTTGEQTFEVDEVTQEVKYSWQSGFKLTKDMLKPFNITVEAGSTSAKKSALDKQSMLELYSVTKGDPAINAHAMLRQLMLAYGKNPDELVIKPEQAMAMNPEGVPTAPTSTPPNSEADMLGALLGGNANAQLPTMPNGSAPVNQGV